VALDARSASKGKLTVMDLRPGAAASGLRLAPWDASGAWPDTGRMALERWGCSGRTQHPIGIAGVCKLGAGVGALKSRS